MVPLPFFTKQTRDPRTEASRSATLDEATGEDLVGNIGADIEQPVSSSDELIAAVMRRRIGAVFLSQ